MARSPHHRLAAVLLAAALTAACSSTVAGSASVGSAATSSAGPPSSASGSPTAPGNASPSAAPGITVPPTAPTAAAAAGEPDGAAGTVGNPGIGDPYYPLAGNGGYQIDSYDIALSYDPPTNALQSTALLKGTVLSEEGLTQFNLDLQPTMLVSNVTVNGAPATVKQDGSELVINPAALLAAQSAIEMTVTYSGKPGLVPGGTSGLSDGGWYRTASGGAVAIGEPSSASAWYPVNEHPADTATFAVTATVPQHWKVISNGIQQTDGLPDPGPGKSVFRWALSEPVASYLTTIYIDDFTLVRDAMADGKPIVSAIAPDANSNARALAGDTKQVLDVLAGYFGPYPFEAAGGIFTGLDSGFALETATRPVYGGGPIQSFETVVHELAHQWFGDSVTVQRWSDICLAECFASYAPWLYGAKVNGEDLDATWKRQMANVVNRPAFWTSPLVDMGPGKEFTRVYDRGPLALHALRAEIGEEAFRTLLKQWPVMYGGKNASFDELETYVSNLAGRDLGPFMDAWFRGTTVPAAEFRYPGNLGS